MTLGLNKASSIPLNKDKAIDHSSSAQFPAQKKGEGNKLPETERGWERNKNHFVYITYHFEEDDFGGRNKTPNKWSWKKGLAASFNRVILSHCVDDTMLIFYASQDVQRCTALPEHILSCLNKTGQTKPWAWLQ